MAFNERPASIDESKMSLSGIFFATEVSKAERMKWATYSAIAIAAALAGISWVLYYLHSANKETIRSLMPKNPSELVLWLIIIGVAYYAMQVLLIPIQRFLRDLRSPVGLNLLGFQFENDSVRFVRYNSTRYSLRSAPPFRLDPRELQLVDTKVNDKALSYKIEILFSTEGKDWPKFNRVIISANNARAYVGGRARIIIGDRHLTIEPYDVDGILTWIKELIEKTVGAGRISTNVDFSYKRAEGGVPPFLLGIQGGAVGSLIAGVTAGLEARRGQARIVRQLVDGKLLQKAHGEVLQELMESHGWSCSIGGRPAAL